MTIIVAVTVLWILYLRTIGHSEYTVPVLLTGPKFHSKIPSFSEVCVHGGDSSTSWIWGQRVVLDMVLGMVLDTKNSILESWQRPRFLILFTMTLYYKMRQLLHYKMQQSLFLLRNASLHCTGIKSAHGVCFQRL